MTLVLPRLICRRCKHVFTPRVAEPQSCPVCKVRGELEVVGSRPSAAILPTLPSQQGQGG